MKKNLVSISIFLFITLLSCSSLSPIGRSGIEKLDFPEASYWRIGWLNNQLVAFINDPFLREEIKYVEQSNSDIRTIVPENDIDCPASYRIDIQSIYNGKIQLNIKCFVKPKSTTYLQILDWDTKTIEKTIGPVPLGTIVTFWNPDETLGLAYFDDGFSKNTLYMMTQDDFGPLDITIEDGVSAWNFSDYYPDFPDIDSKTGNVGRADWSPDGDTVVFFASSDAVGKSGSTRMEASYKLYTMSIDTKKPQPILDDIYFPYTIKWSPDNKYLAFIGSYKDSQNALWVYKFKDFSVIKIDQGSFKDILWDSVSNSLIAIKCVGFNCDTTDINRYDISK